MKSFKAFITELSREKLNDYRGKASDQIKDADDETLLKRSRGAKLANTKIAQGTKK